MKAIIMAGGEGSRLRPLTCDRPKPMVPLMNRPMMEHIVALLKQHQLTDIGVTLQYLPEQIQKYFDDGREFGVSMRYFIEDTPLGTAGSVKNAGDFLDETFLVISGDALCDFDLQQAIEFHRQKGGVATLVLTAVESPLEYGVVIADAGGQISRFLEKPGWGEVFSDTVNTGIYILEPEVLQFIPEGMMFDFSRDLFPLLMSNGYPLYGYVAEGYWCDIGNLKQYHEAHLDILHKKVRLDMQARELSPGVFVGENVIIETGALIEGPVYIGSGTRIRSGAAVKDCSVLGSHTQVEAGASVKRGLCWRNTYLGPGTQVRGAVLCNRVQVMKGSSLFEGSVIGDDTEVGDFCTIKPNVKIWPQKRIDSGSIVSESVIWGTKPLKSLFGFDGISGTVNLEITPELVAKLCVAYGSLLGEGMQVIVSSDEWKASRMLKDAALAGLLSAGLRVVDLGVAVTPLTRKAVGELRGKGGLHIQLSRDNQTNTHIKFFDADGLNLAKGWERKIEQTFYREDFKRIQGLYVGEVTSVPDFADNYRENLLKQLQRLPVAKTRRKVLLAYPTPWLYGFLVPLLQQLHCDVVTLTPPEREPLPLQMMQEQFAGISDAVRQLGADVGVVMDANAEELVLFDRNGRIIADELFTALASAVVFRTKNGSTVAVPVSAPGVIEKLASLHEGHVVRTKTEPRAIMEALWTKADEQPALVFRFDAIASLVHILEFLAATDTDLKDLVDSIPSFFVHKQEVDCPWEVKGMVMRRLIEETRGLDVELIDGVKVRHQDGWALVLPDSEKPVYRVFSEGYSTEAAKELTDMYAHKIRQFQKDIRCK